MLNSSCNYSKVAYFGGINVDTEKSLKHRNTNSNTPKTQNKISEKEWKKMQNPKGKKNNVKKNNVKKNKRKLM